MAAKKKETEKPPEVASDPPFVLVHLKPGHPTGLYHRAGQEFSASAPTPFTQAQLEELGEDAVKRIALDPWLRCVDPESGEDLPVPGAEE